VAGNPSGSYRTTGRRADAGDGGDASNETEDKSRPLYVQNPSISPSTPGFLLYEEAVKIPQDALFKAGDRITYRMPKKPSALALTSRPGPVRRRRMDVMLYRLDTGQRMSCSILERIQLCHGLVRRLRHDHKRQTRFFDSEVGSEQRT
jgi:hypothetical protein